MAASRHPIPAEIAALSLEEIAERYIGRFRDKIPDWEAFEDTRANRPRVSCTGDEVDPRFSTAGENGHCLP